MGGRETTTTNPSNTFIIHHRSHNANTYNGTLITANSTTANTIAVTATTKYLANSSISTTSRIGGCCAVYCVLCIGVGVEFWAVVVTMRVAVKVELLTLMLVAFGGVVVGLELVAMSRVHMC